MAQRRLRGLVLSILERNYESAEDALYRAIVRLQSAFVFPAVGVVDFLVQVLDLLLQRVAKQLGFFPTEFDLHG